MTNPSSFLARASADQSEAVTAVAHTPASFASIAKKHLVYLDVDKAVFMTEADQLASDNDIGAWPLAEAAKHVRTYGDGDMFIVLDQAYEQEMWNICSLK